MKLLKTLLTSLLLCATIGVTSANAACSWDGNTGTVASPYDATDVADCVSGVSVLTGEVTIDIPAATPTWTTSVTVDTRPWTTPTVLTFQGASNTTTVITDNTGTGLTVDPFYVIIDATDPPRVEFKDLGFDGSSTYRGETFIYLWGTAPSDEILFRVSECKFSNMANKGIHVRYIYGLVDNNEFVSTTGQYLGIEGDPNAATRAIGLGGANAVFIEDNTFSADPYPESGVLDAKNGSRLVFRYNTVFQQGISTHGWKDDSLANDRGPVFNEFYNNTFDTEENASHGWFALRGGQAIIKDNVVTETGGGQWGATGTNTDGLQMMYYGLCRDTCGNEDPQTGTIVRCTAWPCVDQPGYVNTTVAPIYISGNTFPPDFIHVRDQGASCNDGFNCATSPTSDDTCTGGTEVSSCYIQEDREYYLSSHPTWEAYTYPNPLNDVTVVTPVGSNPINIETPTGTWNWMRHLMGSIDRYMEPSS
jgi:hypothetical protein